MRFTYDKTEAVLLCKRRKMTDFKFHVGTVVTQKTLHYLGITFDPDFRIIEHVNKMTKKVEKQ